MDVDARDVPEGSFRSIGISIGVSRTVTVPNSAFAGGATVNYSAPGMVYCDQIHVSRAHRIDHVAAQDVPVISQEKVVWVTKCRPVATLVPREGNSMRAFSVCGWMQLLADARRPIDETNTELYRLLEEASVRVVAPRRQIIA